MQHMFKIISHVGVWIELSASFNCVIFAVTCPLLFSQLYKSVKLREADFGALLFLL